MFGFMNVTTNVSGVPYLRTNGITVGAETVDFSLGFRRIPSISYLTINIADAIPTGTTGTLPIRLTLNGQTRNLTSFGGDNVTAADITEQASSPCSTITSAERSSSYRLSHNH